MRDTLRTILVKVAAGSVVETLRFKDEDNYEVDIQLNFFSLILRTLYSVETFNVHFLTRKVSTVIFSEGGLALSGSQSDKTFHT